MAKTIRGATKLPKQSQNTHAITYNICHNAHIILMICWQFRPQSRETNPPSVSKIQCSRSGSCDTTVSQLNRYGLLGVGEGVDRTGLARVADGFLLPLLTPSRLRYPSSRSRSSPRWSWKPLGQCHRFRDSPFRRRSHGRAQTKSC
jgi:hypothetical protein